MSWSESRLEILKTNFPEVTNESALHRNRNITTDSYVGEETLSDNVWYYGEGMVFDRRCDTKNSSKTECTMCLVVNMDSRGTVMHSMSYKVGSKVYVGEIPMEDGMYCLDFSDSSQKRFDTVNRMIAYLIKENCLKRVSLSWLSSNILF